MLAQEPALECGAGPYRNPLLPVHEQSCAALRSAPASNHSCHHAAARVPLCGAMLMHAMSRLIRHAKLSIAAHRYTMMKLVLFPSAETASRPAVALCVPAGGGDSDVAGFTSGTFMHIREDRTESVLPAVQQRETHDWLREHTLDSLEALGYVDRKIIVSRTHFAVSHERCSKTCTSVVHSCCGTAPIVSQEKAACIVRSCCGSSH